MERLMAQVREFMVAAGQQIATEPGDIHQKEADLGLKLIDEELNELKEALVKKGPESLPEIADALGDLLYVTTWTALAFGFPMVEIMDEIQRSNMAKFGPGSRKDPETEKQLKPLDWKPPDIASIINQATSPLSPRYTAR